MDTKSFFKNNDEECAVLSSDIVNTLDFDSSDNAGREREQNLPRMVCGQGSVQSPSILPNRVHRIHSTLHEAVE